MTIKITSDVPLPPGASAWVEQRARLTFGRYAPLVRRILVQMRWRSSPATTLTMFGDRVNGLGVQTTGGDPLGTFNDVLGRAARQLDRKLRLSRASAPHEPTGHK